ncbi:MAG TPA: TPM domain-containing protein [Geobacteraceae bacterium]|nr:TPM domain-containing protein [Geobacteraceae bacterium]
MKHHKAHSFFTEDEKKRIKEAVAAAESGTSGEIATMIVDHCDRYHEAEVLGGSLVSGLVSLIIAVAIQQYAIWVYIPLVCILYVPARLLFIRFPRLKHPFINKLRMMHAVRDRAVRAFYEKGLYKTRDENGVLIFISILERKVWILGDRGVDRKIPHEAWQAHARKISTGIREGRACEALCVVIAECGAILAGHFPRKGDDTNELPDDIIC